MKLISNGEVIDVQVESLAHALIKFRGWRLLGEEEADLERDDCDHGHSFLHHEELLSVACIDEEETKLGGGR